MPSVCYDNYYWQNDLVRLRAPRSEDWERAYTNRFDSAARRMLQCQVEPPPTPEEVQTENERWVTCTAGDGRMVFTIETLDGTAVGGVNLGSIDERNGTFHIGMQIDVGERGKGYGTAAMRILLRYAFRERRLNKFNCFVLEGNVASATMLEKVGCKREGVRRQNIFTDGRYHDAILYGLTKEDYLAANGQEGSAQSA